MKLKLEHLAIDCGGKVDLIRKTGKFKSLNIDLIRCSLHYNDAMSEYYLFYKGVTYSLSEVFPHRRPLSDLTKEITHNGEKFVPIQELFQMAYESIYDYRFKGDFDTDSLLKEHLALKCIEADYNYGFTIELPNQFLMTVNGDNLTIPNFTMYQKFYEWHFNVFNLPENLWIKK